MKIQPILRLNRIRVNYKILFSLIDNFIFFPVDENDILDNGEVIDEETSTKVRRYLNRSFNILFFSRHDEIQN